MGADSGGQCVLQQEPSGDYCTGVSDTLYGPFSEPCKMHDACYGEGARIIVASIEKEIAAPVITLSPARREVEIQQRAPLSRSIQRQCDTQFKQDLINACSTVSPTDKRLTCLSVADTYFLGVSSLGRIFFKRAIVDEINCRSQGI